MSNGFHSDRLNFSLWLILLYRVVLGVSKILLNILQIEMMSEAIDETLDKDEAEEETEELTNQVKHQQQQFSLF